MLITCPWSISSAISSMETICFAMNPIRARSGVQRIISPAPFEIVKPIFLPGIFTRFIYQHAPAFLRQSLVQLFKSFRVHVHLRRGYRLQEVAVPLAGCMSLCPHPGYRLTYRPASSYRSTSLLFCTASRRPYLPMMRSLISLRSTPGCPWLDIAGKFPRVFRSRPRSPIRSASVSLRFYLSSVLQWQH